MSCVSAWPAWIDDELPDPPTTLNGEVCDLAIVHDSYGPAGPGWYTTSRAQRRAEWDEASDHLRKWLENHTGVVRVWDGSRWVVPSPEMDLWG